MKLFRTLARLICAITLVSSTVCHAQVYKWVDGKGKTHFGDKKNSEQSGRFTEKVTIRDKYVIKSVTPKTPIPYGGNEPSRNLAVGRFTLELDNSNIEDVRIGRLTCGETTDIFWNEGYVDIADHSMGQAIANAFEENGYRASNHIGAPTAGALLTLRGKITDLKLNLCKQRNTDKTQNSSYVKIEWELFDPIRDKVLFTKVTEGSHHNSSHVPVKNGTEVSFNKATTIAATNLLENMHFVLLLEPTEQQKYINRFTERVSLSLHYGNRSGDFSDNAEQLKNSSVIIKTENGHGSGVVISNEGHILTNAHVVGTEKSFKVVTENNSYTATLIRKDNVRDVALIKVEAGVVELAVPISISKPKISSDIYVIGTPLAESFSHTITRGIISAKRNMEGLSYYQTDAGINRGNSGGPVFDDKGELIALTVAGMFTRSGASLNLNYLIPIDEVLVSLHIESSPNSPMVIASLKRNIQNLHIPFFNVALDAALDWLDNPLF